MKNLIFIILITINVVNSQTYINTDNGFLGIKHDLELSPVELTEGKKEYVYSLTLFREGLYEEENNLRQIWINHGSKLENEPKEKILLKSDFDSSSDKYKRLFKKATTEIEQNKILLQSMILSIIQFDINEIVFDEEGLFKEVYLKKSFRGKIRDDETKRAVAIFKRSIQQLYGVDQELKVLEGLAFKWIGFKTELILHIDTTNEFLLLIYRLK